MTIPELQLEHKKMVDAISRLEGTKDPTGQFQLQSARALKFALECQLKARADKLPAPAPLGENVLDFAAFKRRADARKHG
jgi:hypothetical protein